MERQTDITSAKQSGIDARRLNIPFHQNPYQYSGSKLKAQKRMWDIGWCEQDAKENATNHANQDEPCELSSLQYRD